MKPLFTIHAGEFLVGQHIESQYKRLNVWVPTKDRGLDLLVTNDSNKRALSIQVKFSRDFLPMMKLEASARKQLRSCTWFALDGTKIAKSVADIWVLVLLGFEQRTQDFLVISPGDLLERLEKIDSGKAKQKSGKYQVYVWVTKQGRAWLTRDLTKEDQLRIAANTYESKERELSSALNNWSRIEQL
jgi:hypothetical protein